MMRPIGIPPFLKRHWRSWACCAILLPVITLLLSGAPGMAAGEKTKQPSELRFGHERHKTLGVTIDNCQDCHSLKSNFEVEAVTSGKDHQPCSNSACHASEYMSKEPTICVVCHESSEPWVKQKARLRELSSSEFSGDISHKTHAGPKAIAAGVSCTNCHGDVLTGESKPNSHSLCGSCHKGAQRPVMSECGGCHSLGQASRRPETDSRYRVTARFLHSGHQRDPRNTGGQAPACTLCHSKVGQANSLAEVRSPTMQSCDTCHDGKLAFKTTGFGCVKCHGDSL